MMHIKAAWKQWTTWEKERAKAPPERPFRMQAKAFLLTYNSDDFQGEIDLNRP